jgi:hypothetical protein
MSQPQTVQVRDDEVIQFKVDPVSAQVCYVGRADPGVAESTPKWQIYRESKDATTGVISREYATDNKGSFLYRWDQRTTYFSAISASNGVSGALTVGTSAVAVRVGASNYALRSVLSLFNNSANTIYWGFTNAVTTSTGFPIPAASAFKWNVDPGVTIWAIAAGAGNDTRVVEL